MPSFVVLAGKSAGTVFDLSSGDTFDVGTARKAQIHLRDAGISYQHARIVRRGQAYVLVEQRAPGGTSVNKSPVSGEYELRPGDVVTFASTDLLFQDMTATPSAAPSAPETPPAAKAKPTISGRVPRPPEEPVVDVAALKAALEKAEAERIEALALAESRGRELASLRTALEESNEGRMSNVGKAQGDLESAQTRIRELEDRLASAELTIGRLSSELDTLRSS
jgi:pSer/pThr/pTyr-binding forkhead associated (FHA) protein